MVRSISAIEYRPDIDGLRAVAILAVVIFHLFPTCLSGGFVGVDIFFVISGYLISSIIFSDLQKNNFSFTAFYARRIKRIFPALLIVLLFVTIVGWLVLLPSEFAALGKHLNSATTFIINRTLYKESGYFDVNSDYKPLLHIWSLSVEEQFYIIFPLCAFIIFKFKRYVLHLIILALLISFYLNVHYVTKNSHASFYSLHTRAWEMLLGSILAYANFVSNKSLEITSVKVKNLISIIAIGLIGYACVFFNSMTRFPGWMALLPVGGAGLLIYCNNTWAHRNILSNRVVIWVGLISYPLYLWHWPLISFARIMRGQEVSITSRLIILFSAILLAVLTTLLIERPLKKYGSKLVVMLLLFMIVVLGVSFPIEKNLVVTKNAYLNPMVEKIDFAMQDWRYGAKYFEKQLSDNSLFNHYGKGDDITVFFGDSNIEQYWPRVEKIMQDNQELYKSRKIVFATYGGLAPIPGETRSYRHDDEKKFLYNAIEYIQDPAVKTVVIGAQWAGYFSADVETNLTAYNDLESFIIKLKNLNKKTYLILNIPIMSDQDPNKMIERNLFTSWKIKQDKNYASSLWLSIPTVKSMNENLSAIAERTGAIIIDPVRHLCKQEKCIILTDDNTPCYKDAVHLNAKFVKENAIFIDQIFAEK